MIPAENGAEDQAEDSILAEHATVCLESCNMSKSYMEHCCMRMLTMSAVHPACARYNEPSCCCMSESHS